MQKVDGFELENGRAIHRPVGWVTFEEAVDRIKAGIARARKNHVRELLVDTTALEGFPSPDTFQRFLAAVEWADEAQSSLRLAMVAREEMIDPQRFGVIVARNRGLESNIFTTEQAARDWLGGREGRDQ